MGSASAVSGYHLATLAIEGCPLYILSALHNPAGLYAAQTRNTLVCTAGKQSCVWCNLGKNKCSQTGCAGGHPGAVQLLAADNATGLLATAAASDPPLLWTQPDLCLVGPVPGINSCTALAWLR